MLNSSANGEQKLGNVYKYLLFSLISTFLSITDITEYLYPENILLSPSSLVFFPSTIHFICHKLAFRSHDVLFQKHAQTLSCY